MARSNPVYYINPNAISITPNANNSKNDLAVYIQNGTKIKVYAKDNSDLGFVDSQFQEWTLTGRNRRLNGGDGPYTIFARINRNPQTNGYRAYLVFAKQVYHNGEWLDTHSSVINESPGLTQCYYLGQKQIESNQSYWYIRLGEVSEVVDNQRTVTLDTGVLGTEQYNNVWDINNTDLPIRMNVAIALGDNTTDTLVSPVPFGEAVTVSAWLIEGWDTPIEADHWEITRDTGSSEEDAAWQGEGTVSDGHFSINLLYTQSRNDLGQLGKETFFTIRAYDESNNVIAERTINIPHEDISSWTVEMDMQSFAIMVDDFGNVEGGLWTEEDAYRTYRLHTAVTVRRGNKYLTLAPNGAVPGIGQYQIYPQAGDCTLMVSNGTVYIVGIDNIKDGVAGTSDDVMTDEWYERMRRMKEATATFTVVCEGIFSTVKSLPISIGHLDTSIVDVQFVPAATSVQLNSVSNSYKGLPIQAALVANVVGSPVLPTIESVALDIDGSPVSWTDTNGLECLYQTDGGAGWDIRFGELEQEQQTSSSSSSESSSADSSSSSSDQELSDSSEGSVPSAPESTSPSASSDIADSQYGLILSSIPNTYNKSVIVLGLTVQVGLAGRSYEYRKTFSVSLVKNGVNSAPIVLYKRSDTAISQHGITGPLYYKFSDGKLYVNSSLTTEAGSAALNGWQREIPGTSDPCYSIQAQAISEDEYAVLTASSFGSVRKILDSAGPAGPMLYPAGKWDVTRTYSVSSNGKPYVVHGEKYYYLNSSSATGSDVPGASDKWVEIELMDTVFVKFGIIDYGMMSSAVFCGDWMFSQYGKVHYGGTSPLIINGTASSGTGISVSADNIVTYNNGSGSVERAAYTLFDATDAAGANGTANSPHFAPSWAVNLKKGTMIAAGGNFNVKENGDLEITADKIDLKPATTGSATLKLNSSSSARTLVFESSTTSVYGYDEWFGFAATTIINDVAGDILSLGAVANNSDGIAKGRLILSDVTLSDGIPIAKQRAALSPGELQFFYGATGTNINDGFLRLKIYVDSNGWPRIYSNGWSGAGGLPTASDIGSAPSGTLYVDNGVLKVKQ